MTGCAATDKGRPCTLRRHHQTECANDECVGCLPTPTTHGNICDRHTDRTAEALRALPQHWENLGEWLRPGEGEFNGQARVTGTPERRSPLNMTIADHREHIVRIMRGWIMNEFAAETGDLDLTMYASAPEIRLTNLTPKALAHWLETRLKRIATRDWAGDFTTEIVAADRRGYGLTHPTGQKTVGAAPCPEHGCSGEVRGVVEPSAILELPALIICSANPDHAWKPTEFLAAGERIRRVAA